MIAASGLTKRYGERTILDGISIACEAGEVVALIGPSGGGKSTLLRCMNGLENFDGGSLRVAGEDLHPTVSSARRNGPALARIRLRVGFVFQQWNLFAHKSAAENVAEALMVVKGVSRDQAYARADELLGSVGLGHRAGAYPHQMSGGEQQRCAIARALAMEPEALLLDEPTSALDPERVGEVLEVLRALAGRGLTMLIATHEMAFAREAATRVVMLAGGKIVEDGPPAQIFDAPRHERTAAFLSSFLGARRGQATGG
jgi:polar amino acid transport system ATP-binding protein